jgi:small-conductance mechanosensitive channel/CRP-like cAMP-binding protein
MDWTTLNDSHWHLGFLAAAPIVIVLGVIVLRLAPVERGRVLRIITMFGISLVGTLVASALGAFGFAAGEKYVRGVFVLLAGVWVIDLVGLALFQVLLRRLGFPQPRILQDVLVVVAVILWGLVRLHYAGVDLGAIVTTSAVLTAVIGLSLQDTLGNILGGLALQLDRSFRVGDWIEVDNTVGRVTEIGWRRTAIDRQGGHSVVIPNSVLVKHKFVVLGQDLANAGHQRRWISFNIDFEYSPALVIEAVEKALASADLPFVSRTTPPCCQLTELAGNPATYAVGYWLTDLGERRSTDSMVRVHIYVALKRANIPLAVPSQNVLLTQVTGEREVALTDRELARRMAALSGVDIFDGFTQDEMKKISVRLKSLPFASGDVLVHQGAKANRLYILVEGEAEVYVETDQHERALVAQLGPGEFFGEYGLMTGEVRTATVMAKTDVECYCLDKLDFRDLLVSRPDVAEQISLVLSQRRSERDSALDELETKAAAAGASSHGDVRNKIWRFFGLKQ